MSPRRQDSQETLLDELVDIGDDKLDGTLPLYIFSPVAVAYSDAISHPTRPLSRCEALIERLFAGQTRSC